MSIYSLQMICGVATALGAIIIIALERIIPYNRNQKFFREGFFTDFFGYTIFQSFVMGVVISLVIQYIDTATGISRLTWIRQWPLWSQVLFFLVLHDFYIYWFHRWQHKSRMLWRIHEAHHSVRDLDWLAGMRSHALEIFINQTIEFLPVLLLGSPEVAVIKGTIDAVWGMYIHANIDVRSGRLQYLINGPEMHRWHHCDREEAHNHNFSTKLAVWDWLFKTDYFPPRRKADNYGLSDVRFPKGYLRQFMFMFRAFRD